MIVLQDIIDLLPDIYNKDVRVNARIIQVFVEEINKSSACLDQVEDLLDIDNVEGVNLDILGADYGLTRGNKTDLEFRALIQARRTNAVDGNNIDAIINYFSFFVPLGNIVVTELFENAVGLILDASFLLDGTEILSGLGLREAAAFNVATGAIDPGLEISLTEALVLLKGGGIKALVNKLAGGGWGINWGVEWGI